MKAQGLSICGIAGYSKGEDEAQDDSPQPTSLVISQVREPQVSGHHAIAEMDLQIEGRNSLAMRMPSGR